MIFRAAPVPSTSPISYETARTFARCFRKLFATPRPARQLFIEDATRRGIDRATVTLQLNPERFGELRPGASGAHRRDAVDAAYEFAYAYHDYWHERLLEEAPILYEANTALTAHYIVRVVTEHSRAAQEVVQQLTHRRQHALVAIRAFIVRFMHVYGWDRRPLRALRKHYRSLGRDATLATLRTSPGTFGPFRTSEIEVGLSWMRQPLFSYVTDAPARAAARELPGLFARAAEGYSRRPTLADIARARTGEREGRAALAGAAAVADHYLRSVDEYIHECALAILRLTEASADPPARWEARLAHLVPMLPATALSLARRSVSRRQNPGCNPRYLERH